MLEQTRNGKEGIVNSFKRYSILWNFQGLDGNVILMSAIAGSLIDDHSLFREATGTDALLAAWTRVWTNGGAAGGDNVTLQRFQLDLHRRIARLSAALRDGTYTPGALRRVDVPKRDGGLRPLAIPCVGDRVAQTAVAQALGPHLDREFEESSYGYRVGRGVKDALRRVSRLREAGHLHVVDADIEDFFGRVPHDSLLARLSHSMSDGPLTALISLWLEHGSATGRGLAQGSPLSPLLANLYLDRLDEAFARRGGHIVRFADDFVILAESRQGAEGALARAESLLAEHGLALNRGKTRVTSFDQGFHFLGTLFVRSMVMQGAVEEDDEALRAMRRLAEADESEDRREAEEAAEFDLSRRSGYDPGHRVLHVVSADRRLSLRNQSFAVEAGTAQPGEAARWREILAVPHAHVDRIDLGPNAEVEPGALRHALATGTLVAFVSGHGETRGWLAPALAERAGRHLAQARHAVDEAARLALARGFVEGRLRNQRALLRRLNRERKSQKVLSALAVLNRVIRAVPHAASLAEAMGREGEAGAAYWPALGSLLEHGFAFTKRVREGDIDPVNILLNVTASLLARDIAVAVCRAGLHPGFGCLHSSADYRDACVFDLMEEFRAPLAESAVVRAVNGRAVGLSDFEGRPGGGAKLRPGAYAAVARAYEQAVGREVRSQRDGRRRTWRGIMLDQALRLAAHVEGRERYRPYVIDY